MVARRVESLRLPRGDLGIGGGRVEAVTGGVLNLLDELWTLERRRWSGEQQREQADNHSESESLHERFLPLRGRMLQRAGSISELPAFRSTELDEDPAAFDPHR